MVDSALNHITAQLNQFLKNRFDLGEDVVVLSNLLEQDGNVGPHVNNKLVLFLVNIEKDAVPGRVNYGASMASSRVVEGYPPIFLNLYVMVAAHFNKYSESLKFISNAISFFQRRPVFDHQNSPDLDPRIDRLVLDIENLDIKDLSTLWGVLSGKYLPSILYKVRMVTFDSGDIKSQVPTFKEPQTSGNQS